MGDDKNHLYSKEDYQKDQQENAKRRTQQGFSRFSIAAATSLNDAGNTQAPEAMQIDTRNSWFRGINDTFDPLSLITVDVFFGTTSSGERRYVTYNVVTVEDDVTFAFSGTPYGKMLPFTLDITIDKPADPRPIILWSSSLVNPPTMPTLTDGLRLILHFETVRDAVSERQVYIGGTIAAGGGGQAQTPWLSNIDADGWNLFDLSNLLFRESTQTLPIGSDAAIWRETDGLHINVPDTKELIFEVNDTTEYRMGAGAFIVEGNNIGDVDTILFTNTVQTIGSISNGLEVRQSDTFDFSWWFNSIEEYTLDQGSLNFHGNSITELDSIFFIDTGNSIFSSASDILYNSLASIPHIFTIGGSPKLRVTNTAINVENLDVINVKDILFNTANMQITHDALGIQHQVPAGVGITIDFSTSGGGSTFNIGQSVTVSNQDFDVNGNAIFLDADADTKWQAGTDDVAQLTIGGVSPLIVMSISQASTVLANTLIMGDDIDVNTHNLLDVGLINTKPIPSGSSALVDLGTIQIITAQKNIEDLVCGTTNFQCLDTTPDFQANSIDGNDLQDNTVSLAQFIHFTGGSIITFSAADVPAYLLAGKEGQVLTAHGADTALSWSELNQGVQDAGFPTTDQSTEFEFDGNWIGNAKNGFPVTGNNVTINEDNTVYVPVFVGRRCKVINLGFNNIGGSTGTMTIEMGLYSNRTDGTNYPETRLESDSFSATASTALKITDAGFSDQNIEPGLYWIAFNPVNIPVGSTIEISGHEPTGAVCAFYYNDVGGTGVMLSCMGFVGSDTTLPVTADGDMTPFNEVIAALWMQVEPNTA